MPEIVPYSKNFAIVIPKEDDLVHTIDKPFSWDSKTGCHRNEKIFREVQQFVLNGELTPHEAMLFIAGKTV